MREAKTAQPDETDEVPFADVDVPVFEERSCPKCGAAVAADATAGSGLSCYWYSVVAAATMMTVVADLVCLAVAQTAASGSSSCSSFSAAVADIPNTDILVSSVTRESIGMEGNLLIPFLLFPSLISSHP